MLLDYLGQRPNGARDAALTKSRCPANRRAVVSGLVRPDEAGALSFAAGDTVLTGTPTGHKVNTPRAAMPKKAAPPSGRSDLGPVAVKPRQRA
jgi:hypothetical protein